MFGAVASNVRRTIGGARLGIAVQAAIRGPFANIAEHAIESEAVGDAEGGGGGVGIAVVAGKLMAQRARVGDVGVAAGIVHAVAPIARGLRPSASGVFPFGLARQPVVLAGPGR